VEPVTLQTERLLLRPFADADADAVYTACQDPDIQYYTPVPRPYRRADSEEFVRDRAPSGWATDSDHILGAFRADDGVLVGSFCLTKLFEGVYELGYWAAKEQRGRGYSTEAARALCDWGFATLDAHRLEWWAMVGNTASRAVAEKLGFTLEGTLRRRAIVNGEPCDWWVGGLLRT
jgi:RimJ/RimL family protein N-acetyltransferase